MYLPDVRNRDPPDPRPEVFEAEQPQQVLSIPHVVPHMHRNLSPNTHHHYLLAWVMKTIYTDISSDIPTPPYISKRANLSPNTTTSLVAGLLVTAFIILAGIFCYMYRRSIRIRQQGRKRRRHHRHRRRPSGVSKMSQGSDAVAGGADGGTNEPPAAAADPPAEA